MDQFGFLPDVIKRHAKVMFGETGNSILERFCDCLDDEYDTTKEEIDDLLTGIDPDTCDVTLLKYLGFLLNEYPDPDWTELQQREFIKNLVALHKYKGTHHNVSLRSLMIYKQDIDLIELWKTTAVNPLESTHYQSYQSAGYPFKSARIDVISCQGACETVGETDYDYMTPSEAEAYLDSLGDVLPVHVLVRKIFAERADTDLFHEDNDDLGCVTYCETTCETDKEGDVSYWGGSIVRGVPEDEFNAVSSDDLSAIQSCVYICETTCEDCCECWGYRIVPDAYGEIYLVGEGFFDTRMKVALPEEEYCTVACEVACEAGPSQTDSVCVVGDQYLFFVHHTFYLGHVPGTEYFSYRFYIEGDPDFTEQTWAADKEAVAWAENAEDCDGNDLTDSEREAACGYSCENATCQSYCETECETGCEVWCQGEACETYCMNYCQENCQTGCQAGYCQVGCEADCETGGDEADILIVEGGEW